MAELIPLGNRVLVVPNEAVEKTSGGIILPDKAKHKPLQGVVKSVGNEVYTVAPTDEIVYGNFTGFEVNYADTKYVMLTEDEVICVVGDPVEYAKRFKDSSDDA
jgi:chaperonin GroES